MTDLGAFLSVEELQEMLPDLIAGAVRAREQRPALPGGTPTMSTGTVRAISGGTAQVQLDEDAEGDLTEVQVAGSVAIADRVPVFFTAGGGAVIIAGGSGGGGSSNPPPDSTTTTVTRTSSDSVDYEIDTGNEQTPTGAYDAWPFGLTKQTDVPTWATRAYVEARIGQAFAVTSANITAVRLVLGPKQVDWQDIRWNAVGVDPDGKQDIVLSGWVESADLVPLAGTTVTVETQAWADYADTGASGRLRIDSASVSHIDIEYQGDVLVESGLSNGGPFLQIVEGGPKTADYTLEAFDFVPCDTSGGSFTLTLPSAPAVDERVGAKIVVAALGESVTIDAGAAWFNADDTQHTLTLADLGSGFIAQYSGGSWYVFGEDDDGSGVGSGSGPWVNVRDFTPDTVTISAVSYPFKTGGRNLGDYNSLLATTNLHNRQNVEANRVAFLAALAEVAAPKSGMLYIPNGNYGLLPGILTTSTNDWGIIGESVAKTTLWQVGAGTLITQRMIDDYWGAGTPDIGNLTALPAIPPLTGFTINGTFASRTTQVGDPDANPGDAVNQPPAGAATSTGMWLGGGIGAYWNVKVVQYDVDEGTHPKIVAGPGNQVFAPVTGSIGVLVQNEGGIRPGGADGFTEECTFGPEFEIRRCANGIVFDRGNGAKSFGFIRFLGLYVQSGKPTFSCLNGAWLYNTFLTMRGNPSGEGVFRVEGSFIDDQNQLIGSKVAGTVSVRLELNTTESTVWRVDKDSLWLTDGSIDIWVPGGNTALIENDIANPGCFNHEGHCVAPDMPKMIEWRHLAEYGTAHRVSNKVFDCPGVIGDVRNMMREGALVRWHQGSGLSTVVKYGKLASDSVLSGDTTRCTMTDSSDDMTDDANPGSMRFSYGNPPDSPFSSGGGNDQDAVIRSTANTTTATTSLRGYNAIAESALDMGIGPVWELTLRRNPERVEGGDRLGYYSFGGAYTDNAAHHEIAGISGYARTGWDASHAGSQLVFDATAPREILPRRIGSWDTAGMQIKHAYSGIEDDNTGDTRGAALLVQVEEWYDNIGSGLTGAGNGAPAPYSLLGKYPRARVELEGPVHIAQMDSFSGAQPAFQHAMTYTDTPVCIAHGVANVAALAGGGKLIVDRTIGFPDHGTDPDKCVLWFNYVQGVFDPDPDQWQLTYTAKDATSFTIGTVTHISGSDPNIPANTQVRGVSKLSDDDGGFKRALVPGQGFLNATLTVAGGERWFPTPTNSSGPDFSGRNWPGWANNWHVGFMDLPVFTPSIITGNPAQSGAIDNIQGVGFSSLFMMPLGGTHATGRIGIEIDDVTGAFKQYGIQNKTSSTFTPVNVATMDVSQGGSPGSITADTALIGWGSGGGFVTVVTSTGVALLTYSGISFGITLTGCRLKSGSGVIGANAKMAYNKGVVDSQVGILIGGMNGTNAMTTPSPLSGATTNFGIRMAIGGANSHAVNQYGILIEDVALSGDLDADRVHVGIWNNAGLVQAGEAIFVGAVDFSDADVTGLTVPGNHGAVVATGAVNPLLADDTTNTANPNTAILPLLAAADMARLQLIRENGNFLAPTKVLNNQPLARVEFAGQYDGTAFHWSDGAYLEAKALQDWGAVARGTRLDVYVAPTNGVTPIATLALVGGGAAGVAGTTWALGPMIVASNLSVAQWFSCNGRPTVAPPNWAAPTGSPSRATFSATSATINITLAQLGQRVAQLILDLQSIGLFV